MVDTEVSYIPQWRGYKSMFHSVHTKGASVKGFPEIYRGNTREPVSDIIDITNKYVTPL